MKILECCQLQILLGTSRVKNFALALLLAIVEDIYDLLVTYFSVNTCPADYYYAIITLSIGTDRPLQTV